MECTISDLVQSRDCISVYDANKKRRKLNMLQIIKMLNDFMNCINWSIIIKYLSTLGDVCLFLIAVYTFRLTIFPKKLKFINFRESKRMFGGDSFEITLENRSLCPVVVTSLELIYENNKIKVFDDYCVVDGFKTATIKMEPYSFICSQDGNLDIDILTLSKMSLWIETSRGSQHVKFKNSSALLYKYMHKKYLKWTPTTVVRNRFNNTVILPGIKYALSFVDTQGEMQTIFINDAGIMSEMLFGYNVLSKEIIENKEMLQNHFDTEFNKRGLSYTMQSLGEDSRCKLKGDK